MLEADSYKDVEIQCGDFSVRAHKIILSSRSPVLAKMLQSDMVEGRSSTVNIRDMCADTFRQFLSYLYTGRLDDALTNGAAISLYEAGDMYGVESLARRCAQFLVQNLTVVNACDVLAVADAHSDKDLKEIVIFFILENEIPKCHGSWRPFCKSHPVLANEVLNRYVELLTASEPRRE